MGIPQLPVYFCSINMQAPDRRALYDSLIDLHKDTPYTNGNNFLIPQTPFFETLYQRFFDTATELFGPLELAERHNRNCWGYVTNKDHYRGGIHHHIRTSTINSVFYFHMPQTQRYRDGSISFYDESHRELLCYKPRQGDLIIFPNYLNHEPNPCPTDEYRIAINMEIICKDIWAPGFNPLLTPTPQQ